MSDTQDKINTKVPLRDIEIYTVKQKKQNAYAAAFIPKINRITVNGEQNKINAFIIHEAWHQRTHESKVHELPMSLYQHHKLRIHDEISAYLVELMSVRQQYIEAKDDQERAKIVNSTIGKEYSWYFDAIASGEISPTSTDRQDPVKEEKFIYHGIKDIYSRVLSSNHPLSDAYRKDQKNLTDTTFNTSNLEDLAPNDKNYEIALQQMYTIGGINFGLFADKDDIDNLVPESIIAADKQIAEGKSREEIEATLDIHLSKKEQRKLMAQRLANKYTGEEIQQILTTELDKEDRKLYKQALKLKDKNTLKEQEILAKDYLKQVYESPEKISVYDMSSSFLRRQNDLNFRTAMLRMRLETDFNEFNKKAKERINNTTLSFTEDFKSIPQDSYTPTDDNPKAQTQDQESETKDIAQAHILRQQRERN